MVSGSQVTESLTSRLGGMLWLLERRCSAYAEAELSYLQRRHKRANLQQFRSFFQLSLQTKVGHPKAGQHLSWEGGAPSRLPQVPVLIGASPSLPAASPQCPDAGPAPARALQPAAPAAAAHAAASHPDETAKLRQQPPPLHRAPGTDRSRSLAPSAPPAIPLPPKLRYDPRKPAHVHQPLLAAGVQP